MDRKNTPDSDRPGEEETLEFAAEELQTGQASTEQQDTEKISTEQMNTEQINAEQFETVQPAVSPFGAAGAAQTAPAGPPEEPFEPERTTAEKLAVPSFVIAIGAAVLATVALILSIISVSHPGASRHSDRGRTVWEETVEEGTYDMPTDRGRGDGRRGGGYLHDRGTNGRFNDRFEEGRFFEEFEEGRRGSGNRPRQFMFEEETIEEDETGTSEGKTGSSDTGANTDTGTDTGTGADSDA